MTDIEAYLRGIASEEAHAIVERKLKEMEMETVTRRSEYVTLKEAENEYDLYGATLYRKIHSGRLNLYGFGGKSLLKRSEIEALIVKRPPRPARYTPPKKQKL